MHLRSYFCQTCGKSYSQNECLRDGYKMYCVDCPKGKVVLAGWPMILISMFLAVVLYLASPYQKSGELWIFVPASVGLFLIGLIRMIQEHVLYRKTLNHPGPSEPGGDEEELDQPDESGEGSDTEADPHPATDTGEPSADTSGREPSKP